MKAARCSVKPPGPAGAAGHLRQFGEQALGLAGQLGRFGCGFVGHQPAQLRIAGEGVDVALGDPVEPQTEHQVVAYQGAGLHGNHANCKTERMARLSEPSPYVEFDRTQWRALRMSTP